MLPKPPLQMWVGGIVAPFTFRLMKDEMKKRISDSNLMKNTRVDVWKRLKKLDTVH